MRHIAAAILSVLVIAGCQQQEENTADSGDREAARASLEAEARQDSRQTQMVEVLQLDATQTSALNDAFSARDEAVGAWLKGEKGTELVSWEAEIKRAAREKKLGALRNATDQAKPLRDELRQLFATHEARIMDVLTPDQQIQWQGFEVSSKLLQLTEDLGLNAQQFAAIEQGGPAAVREAIQRGEPNPKAAAFLELERWMENSVLSEQQFNAYEAVKSDNKLRSLGI